MAAAGEEYNFFHFDAAVVVCAVNFLAVTERGVLKNRRGARARIDSSKAGSGRAVRGERAPNERVD